MLSSTFLRGAPGIFFYSKGKAKEASQARPLYRLYCADTQTDRGTTPGPPPRALREIVASRDVAGVTAPLTEKARRRRYS